MLLEDLLVLGGSPFPPPPDPIEGFVQILIRLGDLGETPVGGAEVTLWLDEPVPFLAGRLSEGRKATDTTNDDGEVAFYWPLSSYMLSLGMSRNFYLDTPTTHKWRFRIPDPGSPTWNGGVLHRGWGF